MDRGSNSTEHADMLCGYLAVSPCKHMKLSPPRAGIEDSSELGTFRIKEDKAVESDGFRTAPCSRLFWMLPLDLPVSSPIRPKLPGLFLTAQEVLKLHGLTHPGGSVWSAGAVALPCDVE